MNGTSISLAQNATDTAGAVEHDDVVSRARASFEERYPAPHSGVSSAGRDATREVYVKTFVENFNAGFRESVIAERERFAAVIASPEYAGREKAAITLLTKTSLDAASLCALLGSFPVAQPAISTQRARDAVGGLVLAEGALDTAGDFERGRSIARSH